MDDVQFKELCTVIKVGKSLSYQDFLDHFQRMNNDEYGATLNKPDWKRLSTQRLKVIGSLMCQLGGQL